MPAWLLAIAIKMVALPVMAFLYWAIAIKGGTWLANLLPEGKLRTALTKERTF